MDLLESIKQWLSAYPGLAGLSTDRAGQTPGDCGLFPLGQEEKSRREDITGAAREKCSLTFALRRSDLQTDTAAGWLLDFQDWVRRQSHAGLVPKLGASCRVRAEKGRLLHSRGAGAATYEVQLIFEYTKE